MIIEFINRKQESHFLISKLSKNGKERYYIVKDKSKYKKSELLTEIPKGYEFYEFPEDGKVVIRKKIKSIITPEEVAIIDDEMKSHLTVKDYLIDKTENSLIVYLAHLDKEDFKGNEDFFNKIQSYWYKLRFEKTDKEVYKAQRFCNLINYFGWITLETSVDLAYLAEKYCFHIDKDSLLEFWIEGEEDW